MSAERERFQVELKGKEVAHSEKQQELQREHEIAIEKITADLREKYSTQEDKYQVILLQK